jgi:hypothetical protein
MIEGTIFSYMRTNAPNKLSAKHQVAEPNQELYMHHITQSASSSLSFLFLILILLLFPLSLSAQLVSMSNGNWTSNSTWEPSGVPAAGMELVILPGHQVTIGNNLSYTGSPMRVDVHGTWRFNGGGAKIAMPANSYVLIHPGGQLISTGPGSSGSSQTISIGGTTYWNGGQQPTVSGPEAYPELPMPVELVSFQAQGTAKGVVARWSTASESNSSHFDLQRSRDAVEWTSAAMVDAAGQSTQIREYQTEDAAVGAGLWYYRLLQVDLDGAERVYHMVAVDVAARKGSMQCHAGEPGGGILQVWLEQALPEDAMAQLVDMAMGRTVPLQLLQSSGASATYRMPELPMGIYLVRIHSLGSDQHCRFVLGH